MLTEYDPHRALELAHQHQVGIAYDFIILVYNSTTCFSSQGPQIRLQVGLVSQFNLWQQDSGSSIVRYSAPFRSCLGVHPLKCPRSFLPCFILLSLRSHRLSYKLGQLVSLIYCRGIRDPRGAQWIDPQRQIGLVWDVSPSCPRSSFPYFILLYYYDSCICFFLLFHPCCSHARGTLFEIHTSCMESPFPAVHTKWSLVFQSFVTSSQRQKLLLILVYNKNNNNAFFFFSLHACFSCVGYTHRAWDLRS